MVRVSLTASSGVAIDREPGNSSSSEVPAPRQIEEIADYIHFKESSRGKNNYSKCAAIGKFNEYGYGIPGDGTYRCFDKGMDRAEVIRWIADKLEQKYTVPELLCKYNTGTMSENCNYLKHYYEKSI